MNRPARVRISTTELWGTVAVLLLLLSVFLAACRPVSVGSPDINPDRGASHQPVPPAVAGMAHCAHEDGTESPYPCVWDAVYDGNRMEGPYGPRWTVYQDTPCPRVTVPDLWCQRVDWLGVP